MPSDQPAFAAGAGFSVSNFAVLVFGALAGGVLAWKMFDNGDIHLKSELALTNQDYIEDEMYNAMRATAAYPSTIDENRDRVIDLIRRHHVDVRNLIQKLKKKEITAVQFRTQLHALAQALNNQLGVSQSSQINRAQRKAECEAILNREITRISGSQLTQTLKDKYVAKLSARKAKC